VLKIPLGGASRALDSGGLDVGVGALASGNLRRRLWLHGNVTLLLPGGSDIEGLDAGRRRALLQSVLCFEYVMNGPTSAVLQVNDNPAPFRTGVEYPDRPRRIISFGLWRVVSPRTRAFLSFSENEFGVAAQVGPDFSVSGGIATLL
jgi:hypothetical protein